MLSQSRTFARHLAQAMLTLLPLWCLCSVAQAEDNYYQLRVVDLQFDTESGGLPRDLHQRLRTARDNFGTAIAGALRAEVAGGEAYLSPYNSSWRESQGRLDTQLRIVMRVSDPVHEVTGTIYLPEPYHFTVPRDVDYRYGVRRDFLRLKEAYYDRLVSDGLAGGAWFRHQAYEARVARLGRQAGAQTAENPRTFRGVDTFDQTYAVFSGGRALSENLQLDRLLDVDGRAAATESLAEIEGITIEEIDWTPLLEGVEPELDPLARFVPHDQHGVFFPSFEAMTRLIDEAEQYGTPLLRSLEPTSENARTLERYQEQLCLTLDFFSRQAGSQVVESIAITGSDPYFRTGTDVAVLLEAEPAKLEILSALLRARYATAIEEHGAIESQGQLAGSEYFGVTTPDRAICSYMCRLEGALVVTNSLAQLELILATQAGEAPSLASLDEFKFFRNRYSRSDPAETAFLMVSDATIRRWCGPRWRIATSRRTQALAILAELQARHADELATGFGDPVRVEIDYNLAEMGELQIDAHGASSSVYGTLAFQTPVRELEFELVTPQEVEAYERYRDRYQRQWRRFFDPIGVQLTLESDQIAVDMTVMPLIDSSSYQFLVDITEGGEISPHAGDRHEEALLYFIFAVDKESEFFRNEAEMWQAFTPDYGNPLGWMGDSVSIYIDEDSFWAEMGRQGSGWSMLYYLAVNLERAPIALRAEVDNSLKAAVFLAALRAELEENSGTEHEWSNETYRGRTYVSVSRDGILGGRELTLYYTITPEALVLTPDEDLIKRSIDREIDGPPAAVVQEGEPGNEDAAEAPVWLGESMGMVVDGGLLLLLQDALHTRYLLRMQRSSFANLAILNEWHARYPDRDPVELHEQLFKTKLVCPGGGEYVWNEELQTMESTVYGSPADPREGPLLTVLLSRVAGAEFGITFENDGLRARMQIERREE